MDDQVWRVHREGDELEVMMIREYYELQRVAKGLLLLSCAREVRGRVGIDSA
jgi:hypothetical protein